MTQVSDKRFEPINHKNRVRFSLLVLLFALSQPVFAQNELVGSDGGFVAVGSAGQAAWTLQIEVPSGVNGIAPEMQLSIASSGQNGPLGVGGNLSGESSITRCGRTMHQDGYFQTPQFVKSDAYCIDGARLVLESGSYGEDGSVYRTEIESFQRVKAIGSSANGSGPAYFVVTNRNGAKVWYGVSDTRNTFEVDPATGAIAAWKVAQLEDLNANTMFYHYSDVGIDETQLTKITYGGNTNEEDASNNLSVRFEYEDRPDTASVWSRGRLYSQTKRVSNVKTYVGTSVVKDYKIEYIQGEITQASRIESVQLCAGDGACYKKSTIGYVPETPLVWTSISPTLPPEKLQSSDGKPLGELIDINHDGKVDWVRASISQNGTPSLQTYLGSSTGWQESSDFTLPNALYDYSRNDDGFPIGVLLDINGDGWPDYVQAYTHGTETVRATYRNTGSGFVLDAELTLPEVLVNLTSDGEVESRADVIDINADGLVDVLQAVRLASGTVMHKTILQNWIVDPDTELASHSWQVDTDYQSPTIKLDYEQGTSGRILASLADVNGDGLNDWVEAYSIDGVSSVRSTWLNTGQGWQSDTTFRLPVALLNYDLGAEGIAEYSLSDINGDGLLDIIKALQSPSPAGLVTDSWINRGNGWQRNNAYELPAALLRIDSDGEGVVLGSLADVNNDGHPDLIHSFKEESTVTEITWLFQPDSQTWSQTSGTNFPFINTHIQTDGTGLSYVHSADLDHDGSAELFTSIEGTPSSVYTSDDGSGTFPGMLSSVTNPLGSITELIYGLSTDSSLYEVSSISAYPDVAFNSPTPLVQEMKTSNGVGGFNTVFHRYGKGKSNLRGKGGLGFGYHVLKDGNRDMEMETHFSQAYPYTGQVTASSRTALGVKFSSSMTEYLTKIISINGLETIYPYAATSDSKTHDLNGNLLSLTETVVQTDNHGNTVYSQEQVRNGSDNTLLRTQTKTVEFENDETDWIFGQATRSTQTLTDEIALKTFTNVATASYDAKGRVEYEIVEPQHAQSVRKDYLYDGFGYRISTIISADGVTSRESKSKYSSDGRFPVWVENAAGHKVTTDFDAILSKAKTVTDANQITKEFLYDGFGTVIRETKKHQSNGATRGRQIVLPKWCLDSCPTSLPNAVYFIAAFDDEGEAPEIAYYDVNGKELRKQTYGFDGKLIVVETVYNENGQVASITQPYFISDEQPSFTEFTYDVLGRQTERKNPANKIFTTDYNGLTPDGVEVVSKNPGNVQSGEQQTKVYNNVFGQPILSVDVDNNPTRYKYDVRGKLIQTIDAKGNEAIITYDQVFGRKTKMDDPDLGEWEYTYNALGNMISQKDAKNQITTMEYDEVNRLVRRVDGLGTPQEEITGWTYDGEEAGDVIGGLKMVASPNYTRTIKYDAYSRAVKATTELVFDGQTQTFTQENGFLGTADKVDWIKYPSGLTVRNTYDEYGFPKSVEGIELNSSKYTDFQDASEELVRRQRVLEEWKDTNLTLDQLATLEDRESDVRRLGKMLGEFYEEFDGNLDKQESEDYAQRYINLIDQVKRKLDQHGNWLNIYQAEFDTRYARIKPGLDRQEVLVELSQPFEQNYTSALALENEYRANANYYGGKINEYYTVINANQATINNILPHAEANLAAIHHYMNVLFIPSIANIYINNPAAYIQDTSTDANLGYVLANYMNNISEYVIEHGFQQISNHSIDLSNRVANMEAAQNRIDEKLSVIAQNNWEWLFDHWETRRQSEEDKIIAAVAQLNIYSNELNEIDSDTSADRNRIENWLGPIVQSHGNVLLSYNDRARYYGTEISIQLGSYAKRSDLSVAEFLKPFDNHVEYIRCLQFESAKSSGDCYAENLVHVYDDDGNVDNTKQQLARSKVDDDTRVDVKQFWANHRFFCQSYLGYRCSYVYREEIKQLAKTIQTRQCEREDKVPDDWVTCTAGEWNDETSSGSDKYPYLVTAIPVITNLNDWMAAITQIHKGKVEYLVERATRDTYAAESDFNSIVAGDIWIANPDQVEGKPQSQDTECTLWSNVSGSFICTGRGVTEDDPDASDPDEFVLLYEGEIQNLVHDIMTAEERAAFRDLKSHQQEIEAILNSGVAGSYNGVYLDVQNQIDEVNRLYQEMDTIYANSDTLDEYEADKKVYWEAQDITAQGQIKHAKYGNGVETEWTYDQFGRIVGHFSQIGGTAGAGLVSNTYVYDSLGNLTHRNDIVEGVIEDYQYDAMNRLVMSTLSGPGAAFVRKMGTNITQYDYDELGNINYKSDIANCSANGCYQYGGRINENGAGPHAVTSIGNQYTFTYDANGNQVSGRGGRTIEYSVFNKPTKITNNSKDTSIWYGPERQMVKQVEQTAQGLEATLYIGSLYEKIKKPGAPAIQRHHISIAGHAIAVVDTPETSIVPIKEHYLHKNHQNSVIAITDMNGEVVERRFFDAFGDVRNSVGHGQDAAYTTGIAYDPVTDLSFTGHRMLKSADLVHMGGRVYDPFIGRFLSADPHIQAPLNSQSFNRYSYVLNNPLSLTDPSGYFFSGLLKKLKRLFDKIKRIISRIARIVKSHIKAIGRAFKKIQTWVIRQAIKIHDLIRKIPLIGDIHRKVGDYVAESSWAQAIIITVATIYGGSAGAAIANAHITYLKGGSVNQIRRAGRSAYLTSKFNNFVKVGRYITGIEGLQKAISAGFNNGFISKLNGGSFSKNFWRGAVTSILLPLAVRAARWIVTSGVELVKIGFGNVKGFFKDLFGIRGPLRATRITTIDLDSPGGNPTQYEVSGGGSDIEEWGSDHVKPVQPTEHNVIADSLHNIRNIDAEPISNSLHAIESNVDQALTDAFLNTTGRPGKILGWIYELFMGVSEINPHSEAGISPARLRNYWWDVIVPSGTQTDCTRCHH